MRYDSGAPMLNNEKIAGEAGPMKQLQRMGRSRWLAGIVGIALLAAGCSSAATHPPATPTPTATAIPTAAATTPAGIGPSVTPVSGAYSLYVDPTWGYSFQYPSGWTPYPAQGNEESNVVIAAPYNPDPAHSMLNLMVRVTSNFQHAYVQQLLCQQPTTTTVAGYPAVDLSTDGGNPTVGYSAVAMSRAFFAKGLAFWIWLQGSDKSSQQFIAANNPIFQQVLATFNVGPGGKTTASC